jgi:parallel beta-helix repeat protein
LNGNANGQVFQANSTSINISGFTITNATDGIILENCSGSVITKNTIKCFSIGIWLHYSNSNTVSNNLVSNNGGCGIMLCGGSSENNITGNTLKENAIGLASTGTNNLIYHNNFITNQNQTQMLSSSKNTWDKNTEGNYWNDYNGTEFDEYGVGTNPYVIDASNQDNFPLKNPYTRGDVNHDAKVNIMDINIVAVAFKTHPGDAKWNLHADIDENNEINIIDVSTAARAFGKGWLYP